MSGHPSELRPWCECDPDYEGRCTVPCALDTLGRATCAKDGCPNRATSGYLLCASCAAARGNQ